ncbi:MAG: penicillin-binding protein 2, partial [Corynebacterium camporealensis]|nr:penicillin-binding protein 2 [Corynebacterium camporealensis]
MTPPNRGGGRNPRGSRPQRAGVAGSARAGHQGHRQAAAPKPASRVKANPRQKELMAQRINIVVAILGVILLVLVGRLAWVQLAWGPDLAAKAEAQRSRVYIEPARRGEVVDREGQRLAYTMQARSLTVSPTRLRSELREQAELEARSEGS